MNALSPSSLLAASSASTHVPEKAGDAPRTSPPSAVTKALQLLSAFRGITPPIGVSELARRAGLSKSTAFRLLGDLEAFGFVQRDGAEYKLGMTMFELGIRVDSCRPNGLSDNAMPYLSQLHVRTGLAAHLGVMTAGEVVHISKVSRGVQTQGLHPQPGSRRPATCSSLGKAILAFSPPEEVKQIVMDHGFERRTPYSITDPRRLVSELARVREFGVARDNEESVVGIIGIAAPIMLSGRPVGAVGTLMNAPVRDDMPVVREVKRTAALISQEHQRQVDNLW